MTWPVLPTLILWISLGFVCLGVFSYLVLNKPALGSSVLVWSLQHPYNINIVILYFSHIGHLYLLS